MPNKLLAVLGSAKTLAAPTKLQEQELEKTLKEVIKKLQSSIKRAKLQAKLILGGSVGRGTYLKENNDIDLFLAFNYQRYKNQSLSNLTEILLKKSYPKYIRLHGSRDYFDFKFQSFQFEIIPVLFVKNPINAKNTTDLSPLHVQWIKKQLNKNKKLLDEIRITKLFLKSNRLYGAESYINGFSGHVIEILICYYNSFTRLLKNLVKYKEQTILDPQKHYSSKQQILKQLNKSKTGPLILIDPIDKNRNAAAALSSATLKQAQRIAKKFLSSPNIRYFISKKITNKDIILNKKKRNLIILKSSLSLKEQDRVGTKILKDLQHLCFKLKKEGYLFSSSWAFPEKLVWFYFPKKLYKTKIIPGPPTNLQKFVEEFTSKYKKLKAKIKIKNNRYIAIAKRKYQDPIDFLRELLKQKQFKHLKTIYKN